jgi:FkbM family methyltransferase
MTMSETEVEERVYELFLSKTRHTSAYFVELGAGNGAQSLKFMRCLRGKRGSITLERVLCVAVEPYPPHFDVLSRNMKDIEGIVVFGAIADKPGKRRFLGHWAGKSGPSFWGGHLSETGELEVAAYTIHDIMEKAQINSITFMHADIQGAEEIILKDCVDLILKGQLENFYVGTHGLERHRLVRRALKPHMNLVLDVPPDSICETPIGKVQTRDGILFFARSVDW